MFGYIKPIFSIEKLINNDHYTQLCEAVMLDTALSFQFLVESSSDMIMNNVKMVMQNNMIKTITLISQNLIDLQRKTLSFLIAKNEHMGTLISKYEQEISALSDMDIHNISYQKVSYNVATNVPCKTTQTLISTAIKRIEQRPIDKDTIKKLRATISSELPMIRSSVLGLTTPTQVSEFEAAYQLLIRKEDRLSESHLTSRDILNLITSIHDYSSDINKLKRNFKTLDEIFNGYKSQIETILNIKYVVTPEGLDLKNTVDKPFVKENKAIGYYNEYQSVLLRFITTMIDMYTTIFKYKMNMVKEKVEYEDDLLKQIIDYINKKGQ